MAGVAGFEPGTKPMRADAVRNREKVIRAAAKVFAEKGIDAGIPEIAARAGVGKATVYRAFPSKDHLVAAVLIERLRWYEEMVDEAIADDDAWSGFCELLRTMLEAQRLNHATAAGMALESSIPELREAKQDVIEGIGRLIRRAQRQGTMRPNATYEDLHVLMGGAWRMLIAEGNDDPRDWRRYADMIADAFRRPAR